MKQRSEYPWAALLVLACSAPWAGCSSGSTSADLAAGDATQVAPSGDKTRAITFVHGYRQGCQAAHEEGKPMLLFFTAQWCGYCHAMERETLHDSQIVELAKQFVCVIVDADAEPDVCRLFRVRGYPTVQFISPRGVALNRLVGKQPVPQLSMEMQATLAAIARRIDHPPAAQTR